MTAHSKDARKELDRERKCADILEQAMPVFAAQGLDGTTLDSIAENSGYAKASLYYYFHGKEEMFKTIVIGSLDALVTRLDGIAAEHPDPVEALEALVDHFVDERFARKGLFQIYHQIQAFMIRYPDAEDRALLIGRLKAVMAGIESLFARGQVSGQLAGNDPTAIAEMFVGMIFGGVFFQGGAVLPGLPHGEFALLIKHMLFRGILNAS
ncbi:MAG: TetR/AcrR family transcriptional regulator [Spirochaetes bacterium]|nr:TetR/AcrR family transcriptional regulator [Spirochaetota bacterium]